MSTGQSVFAGLFMVLAINGTAIGAQSSPEVTTFADSQALTTHLRELGYKYRGGIDRATTDLDAGQSGTFPRFSSSFSVGGKVYPFTMIGNPPASGIPASIKSIIIPLRMNFVGFGTKGQISHSFDPEPAVASVIGSPLYVPAAFPNGTGQFVDQMQRAAFWNLMDSEHHWHVRMDDAVVGPTIDIEVTPETGSLSRDSAGNPFGDVFIDFMDSQIRTILQFLNLGFDTLPIFVTDDVTAEALGYHTAYAVKDDQGKTRLQTFIYTSWLNPALVDPLFADISTINHELAEWTNDPFGNNRAPDWFYPPPTDPSTVCSGNPFLEVGDPQGNGPTFADFPTFVSTVNGVNYHLQQLVLWQWFTDQVPSSAFHGWYTFPVPSALTVPAVYCK
jgi:hypothetical protein